MNELSILMHLLSKQDNKYNKGASKEEILRIFNINNKNEEIYFQNLITNLSEYLKPLGLQIKFNPLDSHWFLTFEQEISEVISANPFQNKPKLAATLFCVLSSCLKNKGTTKLHEIQELRKKKTVMEDLEEIEKMGYLRLNDEKNQIQLTPLIGYELDIEKLFIKLSLNLEKNKK